MTRDSGDDRGRAWGGVGRGSTLHEGSGLRCRRTRESTRSPAADGKQHFQAWVLLAQAGDFLQIRLYFRRQPNLMQLARVFQGRVGFVFLVVIDQAKRVVQVRYLTNVEFIDIPARAGGNIATSVKVAHGHQGIGGGN